MQYSNPQIKSNRFVSSCLSIVVGMLFISTIAIGDENESVRSPSTRENSVTSLENIKRPFDVNQDEYPFEDHWFQYREGYIHYVDEGKGPVVLLLHGNPTWSYLYRNIIKKLSGEFRLIAPDYPGMGMSKAPSG